jgi:TetR/AcrR family fatty acid metabolism transcriptional regulator
MSPKQDVSDERKNQILEAALVVFSRNGFQGTRMDDIVTESGLSKGALYWYFDSKEEIIVSLVKRLFDQEMTDLVTIKNKTGTAYERLLQFTKDSIFSLEQMLEVLPITYEFYAMAFRHEGVREILRTYFRQYLEEIPPVIQQGIDRGEFRKVNPIEVAIATGAIIEGTLLLWTYDEANIDLKVHMLAAMEMLLTGISI